MASLEMGSPSSGRLSTAVSSVSLGIAPPRMPLIPVIVSPSFVTSPSIRTFVTVRTSSKPAMGTASLNTPSGPPAVSAVPLICALSKLITALQSASKPTSPSSHWQLSVVMSQSAFSASSSDVYMLRLKSTPSWMSPESSAIRLTLPSSSALCSEPFASWASPERLLSMPPSQPAGVQVQH